MCFRTVRRVDVAAHCHEVLHIQGRLQAGVVLVVGPDDVQRAALGGRVEAVEERLQVVQVGVLAQEAGGRLLVGLARALHGADVVLLPDDGWGDAALKAARQVVLRHVVHHLEAAGHGKAVGGGHKVNQCPDGRRQLGAACCAHDGRVHAVVRVGARVAPVLCAK